MLNKGEYIMSKAVTVYLPEGYYDQIKAFAEIDKRSLSNEIIYLLAGHVEFVERRWDDEEQRGVPYSSDYRYPHSKEHRGRRHELVEDTAQ